jgi:hypothetical protein
MRLWLIGNEDEKLQRGKPSKPSMAYQRQSSLPLELACVKFLEGLLKDFNFRRNASHE